MSSLHQDGGAGVEGVVSTSAPLSTSRISVTPWNDWTAFRSAPAEAPCQSVVFDPDDDTTVIARCHYDLTGHPRHRSGRYLHEAEDKSARWWLDREGDVHLAYRPAVAS